MEKSLLILVKVTGCNSSRPYRLRNGYWVLNARKIKNIETSCSDTLITYQNRAGESALIYTVETVSGYQSLSHISDEEQKLVSFISDGVSLGLDISVFMAIRVPDDLYESQELDDDDDDADNTFRVLIPIELGSMVRYISISIEELSDIMEAAQDDSDDDDDDD
jgi:hypothetical protein